MPERTGQPGYRPLWTVVGALVVAAGLLWWSSRMTWSWSRHGTPLRGLVVDLVDGAGYAPALVPLAWLALAAVAAVLATGGWPRRVVGALVVLAGMATLWTGTSQVIGVIGPHPVGFSTLEALAGHGMATLAGLLIMGAGGLVVRNADRMPKLGTSYQTPAAARRVPDPDAEMWRALSEGQDPTEDDRPG